MCLTNRMNMLITEHKGPAENSLTRMLILLPLNRTRPVAFPHSLSFGWALDSGSCYTFPLQTPERLYGIDRTILTLTMNKHLCEKVKLLLWKGVNIFHIISHFFCNFHVRISNHMVVISFRKQNKTKRKKKHLSILTSIMFHENRVAWSCTLTVQMNPSIKLKMFGERTPK